jgi:hypothetical protein
MQEYVVGGAWDGPGGNCHISGRGQHVQIVPLNFVFFAFGSFISGLVSEVYGCQS